MGGSADEPAARSAWPRRPLMDGPASLPGGLQLWWASLNPSATERAALAATLTPDELARSASYRRSADQVAAVSSRGWLRRLLGHYLGIDPADVGLATGEHGKPELSDPARRWLGFNVSHSGNLALYAFADRRGVGVDVEAVPSRLDVDGLAARFLTADERASLPPEAGPARIEALLTLWVRKEAVLKGMGVGLSVSPLEVDVRSGSARPAPSSARTHPGRWSVHQVTVCAGYVAAVAVSGGLDLTSPVPASPVTRLPA